MTKCVPPLKLGFRSVSVYPQVVLYQTKVLFFLVFLDCVFFLCKQELEVQLKRSDCGRC